MGRPAIFDVCFTLSFLSFGRRRALNADAEIQSLLQEIAEQGSGASEVSEYSPERAGGLLSEESIAPD